VRRIGRFARDDLRDRFSDARLTRPRHANHGVAGIAAGARTRWTVLRAGSQSRRRSGSRDSEYDGGQQDSVTP